MARQPESPRYILIVGGLFLIAYAAYQVGSAWMTTLPTEPPTLMLTQPYPGPGSVVTPVEPYPGVVITPVEPYPGVVITITPVQQYPEPEITNTLANATSTLTSTNTDLAPTQVQPTATSTPDDTPTLTPTSFPTVTPTGGAYPGPEQTSTPGNTATLDPGDPYPGPALTATPQTLSPTPTWPPTQPGTPTPTPIQVALPTLEDTPTPIITLPFEEFSVISGGSVSQSVWLDNESALALATSNGVYFLEPLDADPRILDEGSPIASIARIPGEDWISAGGRDSLIRIWDEATGSFVHHLSGHLLGVVRLSYSWTGGFLASASDDATVRIWDVDGISLHTLRGPITRVVDMAVSSDGQMVAAASNQHVHIWSPFTGELSRTISQPEGWYTAAVFAPNRQILTTAYDGRRLEFWDTGTWERVGLIPMNAPVQSLAYSPDGSMLAVGYADGRIQIWAPHNEYLLADLAGHQQITGMAFSPFGDQLVTSSADGSIRLWDLTLLLKP
jgi:WD40 repeat protein